MTDNPITILQMPPQDVWGLVLALSIIVGVLVTYLVLSNLGKAYHPPSWGQESVLTISVVMVLGVLSLGLFGMTIWAAFVGTYQLLHGHSGTATSATPNSGLGALGLGTLLAGLLSAPFLIWSTAIKNNTLAVSRETLALSETALFSEKVNAALEGLYSRRQITRVIKAGDEDKVLSEWEDDIVQRNGAIDRLEGLANERPSEVPRIANMLSVYVRELSRGTAQSHPSQDYAELVDPISGMKGISKEDALAQLGVTEGDVSIKSLCNWARGLEPFRTDVEKAAQTLGRLLDVAGADATTIGLRGANLQGFDLNGLCFDKAKLQGARMEGAKLWQARMQDTKLLGARMEGADLFEVQITGADLAMARMEGAGLRAAQMKGADLTMARMARAVLYMARMEGADLSEARMDGANLKLAQMEGNLWQARMEGADLRDARVDANTYLTAAVVSKAAVSTVDFSETPISLEQVKSMFGDASVTLPNGVTPTHPDWPKHWPKFELRFGFNGEWEKWKADPAAYVPPVEPDPND